MQQQNLSVREQQFVTFMNVLVVVSLVCMFVGLPILGLGENWPRIDAVHFWLETIGFGIFALGGVGFLVHQLILLVVLTVAGIEEWKSKNRNR
jgi:hypothetical protein